MLALMVWGGVHADFDSTDIVSYYIITRLVLLFIDKNRFENEFKNQVFHLNKNNPGWLKTLKVNLPMGLVAGLLSLAHSATRIIMDGLEGPELVGVFAN